MSQYQGANHHRASFLRVYLLRVQGAIATRLQRAKREAKKEVEAKAQAEREANKRAREDARRRAKARADQDKGQKPAPAAPGEKSVVNA